MPCAMSSRDLVREVFACALLYMNTLGPHARHSRDGTEPDPVRERRDVAPDDDVITVENYTGPAALPHLLRTGRRQYSPAG